MLILKLTTWVPLTNSKNKGQADDSKVDTGAPSVSYMKDNLDAQLHISEVHRKFHYHTTESARR